MPRIASVKNANPKSAKSGPKYFSKPAHQLRPEQPKLHREHGARDSPRCKKNGRPFCHPFREHFIVHVTCLLRAIICENKKERQAYPEGRKHNMEGSESPIWVRAKKTVSVFHAQIYGQSPSKQARRLRHTAREDERLTSSEGYSVSISTTPECSGDAMSWRVRVRESIGDVLDRVLGSFVEGLERGVDALELRPHNLSFANHGDNEHLVDVAEKGVACLVTKLHLLS